ncbi:MAG: hypothetical protein JW951_06870, partial [Lentisphaerae bacterium]|nr:hypothetical protein [Lentisphaerota bacterium]
MIRRGSVGVILTLFSAALAGAQVTQSPAQADDIRIPTKWFQSAKGYAKALDLQKVTQADLFLFFKRPNT